MNKANIGASTNIIQIIFDMVICFFSFLISGLITNVFKIDNEFEKSFTLYIIFVIVYILANKDNKLYNITTFYYVDRIVRTVTKAYVLAAFCVTIIVYTLGDSKYDEGFTLVFLLMSYFLLVLSTLIYRYIQGLFKSSNETRSICIGKIQSYDRFSYFKEKTGIRDINIGYVSKHKEYDEQYLGNINSLEEIIRTNNIDVVYFIVNDKGDEKLKPHIELCERMGVTVKIVLDLYRASGSKFYISTIGTYPVLTYHCISFNVTEKLIKRIMDIVGAIVGIIISSPIMLVSAILIKLTSKGPVIFKQERVGMNGRVFYIYKFRTMIQDADQMKEELMEQNEADGFMFKMKDDPRITKIGKILRKTSIDELPQFFNVLFGSMSLVGTRPPTLDEVSHYETDHWKRICIKPGITGMWQVSGRSNLTSFDEVVMLDTQYIDEWSVLLDIKILIKTVFVLLKRDGAY